ncbi:MAG: phage tail terminator protein [Pseudomonadota bacterium]
MLGTDVEARLATVTGLALIAGAAGLAALRQGDRLTVPPQTPAAFVIVLREDPQADQRTTDLSALQRVIYHLAVITVVRVANDRQGERTNAIMDQVRQGIRDALYGWVPPGFEAPLVRGPSALFDFEGGAHWHQDEFITERYEVPISG